MSTILAIETSSDACSVAVSHNGLIQETFIVQPREHNRILLPMVEELLRGQRLTMQDIDALTFGAGPGSFTGLRLSASVVQGLAFAACKPVIPISSLAALAYSAGAYLNRDTPQTLVTVMDARLQDVYFAVFRYAHGSLTRLKADALLPATHVADQVSTFSDLIVIGDGWPDVSTTPTVIRPDHVISTRQIGIGSRQLSL
jgi:tRNA threonylcarbamoyladenosine biosynthesis protein TsaB